MSLNCGILYLAFGPEFDKLNAATAKYSRRFTNLPFCVLSNLKSRSPAWNKVSNVFFKYLPMDSSDNRRVKVSLISYSPFDKTLFMDSDAVIQNPGIEKLFDYLEDYDIVCQLFGELDPCELAHPTTLKTYGKLAGVLNESFPINLYSEAGFLFRRSGSSREFFCLWQKYWRLMGCGRDMPGFSFAVKHRNKIVKSFDRKELRLCTNVEDDRFYIQHKGFDNFQNKFNLPEYIDWNPKI